MKRTILFFTVGIFTLLSLLLLPSCEEAQEALDDAQKTAALRNVTISFDSLETDVELPEATLEGNTFQELYENNTEKFNDPSNYVLKLSTHYTVDNTKENAEDARFSGMYQDIVFNDIEESPVRFETEAFEIVENTTRNVSTTGEINLDTHRKTGLYIFQQIIDEQPLDTRILNRFLYDFGVYEGDIELPEIQKQIPVNASDETKAFLSGLIESGIFAEN